MVVVRDLQHCCSSRPKSARNDELRGSMKARILLCGVLMLVTVPLGVRTGDRLSMRVSPTVAIAPADLIVRTTVESNSTNRSIEIIAESADFYRSSEIPLDGERAARSAQFAFRNLPGGEYNVRAVLKGANEEQLAQTRQDIKVISGATER
jgi:hypothetical protein